MTLSKKALLSAILLATAYPIYAADDELNRKGTPPHVVPLSRDQRSDDPSAVTASGSAVTASGSAIGHKIPADPTPMASAPRGNSIADELARIRSQQLSDENHHLQQACDSLNRTVASWKDRSAALSAEIAQLRLQLAQSHDAYISVVTGHDLLRGESEDLARQIQNLQSTKSALTREDQVKTAEIHKLRGQVQGANAEVATIQEKLAALKAEYEANAIELRAKNEEQRVLLVANMTSNLAEVNKLKGLITDHERTQTALREQEEGLRAELHRLREGLAGSEASQKELRKHISSYVGDIQRLQAEIEEKNSDLEEADARLVETEEELERARQKSDYYEGEFKRSEDERSILAERLAEADARLVEATQQHETAKGHLIAEAKRLAGDLRASEVAKDRLQRSLTATALEKDELAKELSKANAARNALTAELADVRMAQARALEERNRVHELTLAALSAELELARASQGADSALTAENARLSEQLTSMGGLYAKLLASRSSAPVGSAAAVSAELDSGAKPALSMTSSPLSASLATALSDAEATGGDSVSSVSSGSSDARVLHLRQQPPLASLVSTVGSDDVDDDSSVAAGAVTLRKARVFLVTASSLDSGASAAPGRRASPADLDISQGLLREVHRSSVLPGFSFPVEGQLLKIIKTRVPDSLRTGAFVDGLIEKYVRTNKFPNARHPDYERDILRIIANQPYNGFETLRSAILAKAVSLRS